MASIPISAFFAGASNSIFRIAYISFLPQEFVSLLKKMIAKSETRDFMILQSP